MKILYGIQGHYKDVTNIAKKALWDLITIVKYYRK